MPAISPTGASPATSVSSPTGSPSSQTGTRWPVYVGNSPGPGRAEGLQRPERSKGPACFRGPMRLLGIGNPSKAAAVAPMSVAFHGTTIRSAIDFMRFGLKERDCTAAQSRNLAAGRLCIARELHVASDYAKDRLEAPLGSIAAVMAVIPRTGTIDVREQCDSGGLEPIQGYGHDAEFSVAEALYSSLDVQLHSIICRVPDGVATFQVLEARVSGITMVDDVQTREIALSVVEMKRNGDMGPASRLTLDISTGRVLSWSNA